MPALSNKMSSRPDARMSVTAGSQLSSVPVKCCRQMRGGAAPPPKRRYAYVSFAVGRNCVGAVMLLRVANEVDISHRPTFPNVQCHRSLIDWLALRVLVGSPFLPCAVISAEDQEP